MKKPRMITVTQCIFTATIELTVHVLYLPRTGKNVKFMDHFIDRFLEVIKCE